MMWVTEKSIFWVYVVHGWIITYSIIKMGAKLLTVHNFLPADLRILDIFFTTVGTPCTSNSEERNEINALFIIFIFMILGCQVF